MDGRKPIDFVVGVLIVLLILLVVPIFFYLYGKFMTPRFPKLQCAISCMTLSTKAEQILNLSHAEQIVFSEPSKLTQFTGEFDLTVDLKVGSPNGSWRVVLHRGEEKQRLPLIALFPMNNRLHLRLSTDKDWNDGLDSPVVLPVAQWVRVDWRYRKTGQTYLHIEFLEDPNVISPEVEFFIGKALHFGNFKSVKFPQNPEFQVRNFTMVHN